MELEHLLDVVDVEDVGWFFVRLFVNWLDPKLNGEAIRDVDDLALGVTGAQESANCNVGVVFSSLPL